MKPPERNERVCEGCSDTDDDSNDKSGIMHLPTLEGMVLCLASNTFIQDLRRADLLLYLFKRRSYEYLSVKIHYRQPGA